MKSPAFPAIDLFAGPGGLGEGFAAFKDKKSGRKFDVRLSIEMDAVAHSTLLLRKFFRSFEEPPREYYAYLRGGITREELFKQHRVQFDSSLKQAWRAELGRSSLSLVTKRINAALQGSRTWTLIGGPPCQAYSLVGRSRMQSRTNSGFENDHRHFLYREYLRIVARHRPPVFLMENVKGLLSATHGGERIFDRILADLHEPGRALKMDGRARLRYRLYPVANPAQASLLSATQFIPDPQSLVVRSEDYGIPQARHRIFVLGIREDIKAVPRSLVETAPPTVAEVIGDLAPIRSTLSRETDSVEAWQDAVAQVRKQAWFREPRSEALRQTVKRAHSALADMARMRLETGSSWRAHSRHPTKLNSWYRSGCIGITNHEARGHMSSDLQRYFFAACFAKANQCSPILEDFPRELMPLHRNAELGRSGQMFADRFRVQLADHPGTTVTSHISKDGHYYIHYEPTQCRSLTVREAARLQTFPDNYHFEGPRTEQYHQVGNAVPPLLARQIAGIVHDVLVQI